MRPTHVNKATWKSKIGSNNAKNLQEIKTNIRDEMVGIDSRAMPDSDFSGYWIVFVIIFC